jgi:glutathione synthase/RimK-type ligase-like ATP-grasp enzyme
MKIAIHNHPGSFSDRWITYCQENDIPYLKANCHSSDIIEQVKGCNGLMWHWYHDDYRDQNFARQLIFSIEKMGIKVFPNFNSCWHFDDKVGQKYLLEAVKAPLVPCYIFYDKKDALKWIVNITFPKVFKLKGGAGSSNIKLVNNTQEARKLIKKSFRQGFPLIDKISGFKQRLWVLKRDKNIKALIHVIKGIIKYAYLAKDESLLPRQKGYVYFQNFIPNNDFDDRIIVIGDKAIAIRRHNRYGDFRASGSGLITYNSNQFKREAISIAFNVAGKIKSQSLAFDFLYDETGNPLIVEISYAYSMGAAYDNCPGYWDKDLNWHEDDVNPQRYIIEDFINSLK